MKTELDDFDLDPLRGYVPSPSSRYPASYFSASASPQTQYSSSSSSVPRGGKYFSSTTGTKTLDDNDNDNNDNFVSPSFSTSQSRENRNSSSSSSHSTTRHRYFTDSVSPSYSYTSSSTTTTKRSPLLSNSRYATTEMREKEEEEDKENHFENEDDENVEEGEEKQQQHRKLFSDTPSFFSPSSSRMRNRNQKFQSATTTTSSPLPNVEKIDHSSDNDDDEGNDNNQNNKNIITDDNSLILSHLSQLQQNCQQTIFDAIQGLENDDDDDNGYDNNNLFLDEKDNENQEEQDDDNINNYFTNDNDHNNNDNEVVVDSINKIICKTLPANIELEKEIDSLRLSLIRCLHSSCENNENSVCCVVQDFISSCDSFLSNNNSNNSIAKSFELFAQDQELLIKEKLQKDVERVQTSLKYKTQFSKQQHQEQKEQISHFEHVKTRYLRRLQSISENIVAAKNDAIELLVLKKDLSFSRRRIGSNNNNINNNTIDSLLKTKKELQTLKSNIYHRQQIANSLKQLAHKISFTGEKKEENEEEQERQDRQDTTTTGMLMSSSTSTEKKLQIPRSATRVEIIAMLDRKNPKQESKWNRILQEDLEIETANDILSLMRDRDIWTNHVLIDEPLLKVLLKDLFS